MSCINVFYRTKSTDTPNVDSTNVHGDLHVNYWKLPERGASYKRAIDIGIYLEDVNSTLETVTITLPFIVKKGNVIDLSSSLHDENFLSYLFNASYQIVSLNDCPTYRYAKDRNGIKSFCIYELCQNSIEVKPLEKGSQIIISFLSTPKNLNEIQETVDNAIPSQSYNLYFRFRVDNLVEDDLCFSEDISNDFLQSAFSKSEMSHIKINEMREINHSDIQELLSRNSFVSLDKFHFFFIGSSEDETVSGSSPYLSCSLLEPTIWKNYIGNLNPLNKKCICYHWSSKNVDKHSVFFKTVYSSRDKRKLIKYALVVIALSFIAAVIWDGLKFGFSAIIGKKHPVVVDSVKYCPCIPKDSLCKDLKIYNKN